jgi:cytidine deaminase
MIELKIREIERLVRAAVEARDQAYAPHSHFYVGAAVWIPGGEIVGGCNVENASCSLSLCAERVATVAAVSQGYREFLAIAVANVGGVSPCGVCRQFLSEFGCDLQVITTDVLTGTRRIRRLSELLQTAPDALDTSTLSAP